jgi:hypothetical protein
MAATVTRVPADFQFIVPAHDSRPSRMRARKSGHSRSRHHSAGETLSVPGVPYGCLSAGGKSADRLMPGEPSGWPADPPDGGRSGPSGRFRARDGEATLGNMTGEISTQAVQAVNLCKTHGAGQAAVRAADPDFEVVGEAAGGSEALRRVEAAQPDVILMDQTRRRRPRRRGRRGVQPRAAHASADGPRQGVTGSGSGYRLMSRVLMSRVPCPARVARPGCGR